MQSEKTSDDLIWIPRSDAPLWTCGYNESVGWWNRSMPGVVSRTSKLGTWPTWRPGYSQSPQPYSHDSPGFLHPPTHCERFVLQVHDMDVCFRRSTVEVKRPRLNGDSHGDTDRDGSFACPVLSISVPIVDVTLNTLLSVCGRPVRPISSEGIKGIKGIGEWNIRYLLANHGAKNVSEVEVERLSQQIRCLDLDHLGVLFVTCVDCFSILALSSLDAATQNSWLSGLNCPDFEMKLSVNFHVQIFHEDFSKISSSLSTLCTDLA